METILKTQATFDWKNFLAEGLLRGGDEIELIARLLECGVKLEAIREFMFAHQLVKMSKLGPYRKFFMEHYLLRGDEPHAQLSQPFLVHPANPFHPKKMPPEKIQLYTIDNFLTQNQCAYLLKLSETQMQKALVARPNNQDSQLYGLGSYAAVTGSVSDQQRNSCTRTLTEEIPAIGLIEDKISAALGLSTRYAESLIIQRYEEGQEFKAHWDYFSPGSYGYESACEHKKRGNRTWTFMVYLNDVKYGGETFFTQLDYMIKPKAGMALIWNNRFPDGKLNPFTEHASLPVLEGIKVIITMWFYTKYGH